MRMPRNGLVSGWEDRRGAAWTVLAPSICFAAAEPDLCLGRQETIKPA